MINALLLVTLVVWAVASWILGIFAPDNWLFAAMPLWMAICLLDFEMPRADGLEAAAQILASVTSTRVIIVTRHARPRIVRRALTAGVSALFPSPHRRKCRRM